MQSKKTARITSLLLLIFVGIFVLYVLSFLKPSTSRQDEREQNQWQELPQARTPHSVTLVDSAQNGRHRVIAHSRCRWL